MKCRRCNTELAYDDKRKCHYCPECHPLRNDPPPVTEKLPDRRIDVKPDEKRVIEIIKEIVPDMIRNELENWYVQKPPITRSELEVNTEPANVTISPDTTTSTVSTFSTVDNELLNEIAAGDWRDTARSMGIKTFQKSKDAVMREIEQAMRNGQV